MSKLHPIIAVTGSSGAGTSSVSRTFGQIFRREQVRAAFVEGDAFHRFDRSEMAERIAAEAAEGNHQFSHFGPEANLFEELETLFRDYGATGGGRMRRYLHDEEEAAASAQPPGTFTPWDDVPPDTDLLFYEGLHGAVTTDSVDAAQHVDLLIGVVPVINLEWIQKIQRDKSTRGYSTEAVPTRSFGGCPTTSITSALSSRAPTSTFNGCPSSTPRTRSSPASSRRSMKASSSSGSGIHGASTSRISSRCCRVRS